MTEPVQHRPGDPPHPVLRAMLICDYTIRDGQSGKVSVVGIFSEVQAMDFPVIHPALCVYVNVDDAQGVYLMRLELVRVEDDAVVGKGEMSVPVADMTKPTEIVFQLRNVIFDRAAAYQFRFWANGRYVGAKTFQVVRLQQKGRV